MSKVIADITMSLDGYVAARGVDVINLDATIWEPFL